ncbi:MAG: hypothetical protein SGILL_001761 [Bacillariaceae sp.]
MSTEQEEDDNVVKLMLITCGVAGAVFTFLYLCYFRKTANIESNVDEEGTSASAEALSVSSHSSKTDGVNNNETNLNTGRIRATHAWEQHKERQPGDPWEYNVQLSDADEDTHFVAAPLISEACRATCEVCLSRGKLLGPEHFVSLDPTRPGVDISSDGTFAQCFAPTIPVDALSSFYNCGQQRAANGTCYLLEDTAAQLEAEQSSVGISLTAAYCCFAGSAVIFCIAGYFMYQNKKVREKELSGLEEAKTAHDAEDEGGASAAKEKELTDDGGKVDPELGQGDTAASKEKKMGGEADLDVGKRKVSPAEEKGMVDEGEKSDPETGESKVSTTPEKATVEDEH